MAQIRRFCCRPTESVSCSQPRHAGRVGRLRALWPATAVLVLLVGSGFTCTLFVADRWPDIKLDRSDDQVSGLDGLDEVLIVVGDQARQVVPEHGDQGSAASSLVPAGQEGNLAPEDLGVLARTNCQGLSGERRAERW